MTCDRVADQSLGRSGGLFPGSRDQRAHDPKRGNVSRGVTRDMSGDTFPGSCGRGVVLAM